MTAQTFDFEGQQLTVRQIREIVPAFSDCQVRRHLQAGRNTRAAMLNHSPTEAIRRAGRKGKKAAERAGRSKIVYGFNINRKGQ
jgi:hypothetical protein